MLTPPPPCPYSWKNAFFATKPQEEGFTGDDDVVMEAEEGGGRGTSEEFEGYGDLPDSIEL